jgi:hypothetical protein
VKGGGSGCCDVSNLGVVDPAAHRLATGCAECGMNRTGRRSTAGGALKLVSSTRFSQS